ncbi:MAG: hypothetical protein HGA19_07930 [Oscillochloris sp.]|nr:hypothetical protein [Oscillochloris sp.]
MELIAIHWLPLYVLLLMRALARPGILRLLAAALALLVTTLASQYYGLYAVVYTAGHGLLATMIAPHNARLRTFRAVAAVGVFWILGLVPIILAVGGVDAAVLEDWYVRQVFHSVSLIDLIAPNIQHPIWGPTATAWLQGLHPFGLETGAGVGLVITILSLLALARRPRQSWPWAILAFGTLLLAMGPQLRLTTADSPVPGPFLLLDLIGPFRNSSRPSVFLALTMIALAVLAAEGFASLRDFHPARWTIAVLLIAELSVAPWPITSISAASVYHLLNADPIPGAVFDLPPRNNDSVNLLKQICHGRPIIGGYLARLPDYALSSYPSAFKGLWDAAAPAGDMLELNPAAELATLGIRYVTLDLTHLNRNEEQHLRARLAVRGIRRSYADDQLEIYMVNPAAAHTVAVLGPGWYDVESNKQLYWRWMQNHATLSLIAPTRSVVKLNFTATAYAQGRPLKIWLGDQLLASVEIPAAPYDHTVSLQLILSPGQTDLILESPAVRSPEGRLLSLSVTGLTVTSVPTVLGYASQQLLAIPPTLPTLVAPPCSH